VPSDARNLSALPFDSTVSADFSRLLSISAWRVACCVLCVLRVACSVCCVLRVACCVMRVIQVIRMITTEYLFLCYEEIHNH
jgi:hypothetical protein